MGSQGRRYDTEPKLNVKKIFGVLIAIAVVIMVIITIVNICKGGKNGNKEIASKYYTSYNNNLFGVINNLGESTIPEIYDEYIVIPNKERDIFICTYDVNDTDGTYKTKVLNSKNEEIFKDYTLVEPIDNTNSSNEVWYEDNLLRVQKNGKWGLIDFSENEILPCEYDEITALTGTKENVLVKKEGLVGLVNNKGQFIINPEYSNIISLKDEYKNEYIVVNAEGKYGLVSTTGKVVLELKYEQIKYVNNASTYACKLNNVWQLVNNEGTVLIDGGYDDIIQSKGENAIVVKGGKYGIVNSSKTEVVPFEYEEIKYAFSIYYIAKKDGKYGVINASKEEIIPFEYQSMNYIEKANLIEADTADFQTAVFDSNLSKKLVGIISELNTEKGYIKAYINGEYKYYNFKFEEKQNSDLLSQSTLFLNKKDGKYGYVDKSGNVIVDYIYEDGTEQNSNGYCAVKKNGVWGSINKIGAESIAPSINLDNSIYIDFIANWHLSDDGLYYTK